VLRKNSLSKLRKNGKVMKVKDIMELFVSERPLYSNQHIHDGKNLGLDWIRYYIWNFNSHKILLLKHIKVSKKKRLDCWMRSYSSETQKRIWQCLCHRRQYFWFFLKNWAPVGGLRCREDKKEKRNVHPSIHSSMQEEMKEIRQVMWWWFWRSRAKILTAWFSPLNLKTG